MNLLEDFNIFRTQNGSFLCFEQLAVFLLLTWVECCVVLRLRQCFPVQQLTGPLGRFPFGWSAGLGHGVGLQVTADN